MPSTPTFALPYPAPSDPVDVPSDLQKLAVKLDSYRSIGDVPLVSALPAPSDGLEVYYLADATNGIVWHLRYRAASLSAHKWEYVGGPALSAAVDTQETLATGATAFVDAPTAGPVITVPLAGDYDYDFAANTLNNAGASGLATGLGIAGVLPAVPHQESANSASSGAPASTTHANRLLDLAAGTALKLMYQRTTTAIIVRWRYLRVRPIRVH